MNEFKNLEIYAVIQVKYSKCDMPYNNDNLLNQRNFNQNSQFMCELQKIRNKYSPVCEACSALDILFYYSRIN